MLNPVAEPDKTTPNCTKTLFSESLHGLSCLGVLVGYSSLCHGNTETRNCTKRSYSEGFGYYFFLVSKAALRCFFWVIKRYAMKICFFEVSFGDVKWEMSYVLLIVNA
jgi:hypothetical protein